MELLTLGAGALIFIGGKFVEWGMTKVWDAAYDDIMDKMAAAAPETAAKFALPPEERINMQAELIAEVEQVAQQHPEVKVAVEALGNDVNQAAKNNPELGKAIKELIETLKNQRPSVVHKKGIINEAESKATINNPVFHFND